MISLRIKIAYANNTMNHLCKLENRTFVFDVCKVRPHLIIPTCIGYCSSKSHWSFHQQRFVFGARACTVTKHRTEYFVCPDHTHTAIQLMIPLECSCSQSSCFHYYHR